MILKFFLTIYNNIIFPVELSLWEGLVTNSGHIKPLISRGGDQETTLSNELEDTSRGSVLSRIK